MNGVNLYILLAVFMLVISRMIDFHLGLDRFKSRYTLGNRLFFLNLFGVACSVVAIYCFVVFAERKIYQVVNSKVVLDFYYPLNYDSKDKILEIDNRGIVDVEDIHVYFTRYTFDSAAIDPHGFFRPKVSFLKSYSTFGEISDTVITGRKIRSGDTAKMVLNKMIIMDTVFPPKQPDLYFYAIRISFRNSLNGELLVKYLFTPRNTKMPDWIENNITLYRSKSIEAGPVDTSGTDRTAQLRGFVIKHQMSLFGDDQDRLFKN
jgi:hypothetical protein